MYVDAKNATRACPDHSHVFAPVMHAELQSSAAACNKIQYGSHSMMYAHMQVHF